MDKDAIKYFIEDFVNSRDQEVKEKEIYKSLKMKFGLEKAETEDLLYELCCDGALTRFPHKNYFTDEDGSYNKEFTYGHLDPSTLSKGLVKALQGDQLLIDNGETSFWAQYPLSSGIFVEGDEISYSVLPTNEETGKPLVYLNYIKVINPVAIRVVCKVSKRRDATTVFVPMNSKKYRYVYIIPENEIELQDTHLVVVELHERILPKLNSRYRYAKGSLVEKLDGASPVEQHVKMAIIDAGIPYEWSEKVLQEAGNVSKKISKKDLLNRVDLRELPLVTIDGDDSKDFDDAVYCEPLPEYKDGWKLYVAIADVSYYVRQGLAMDQEAYKRGNSVYFPNHVVPMLPERLSNGICSLNPNEDRLCLTCEMIISREGRLVSYKFYPAVMHSHARLTYNIVHAMLWGDTKFAVDYGDIYPVVHDLYEMYQAMDHYRKERGVVEFESEETKFFFDENGKVEDLGTEYRFESHKIIEECMIAANVAAASYIIEHKYKTLFRVHPKPSEEKVRNFRNTLSWYGLTLGGEEIPSAADYAQFLESISERPDSSVLQVMMLRSLAKAVYSPDNCGHFALVLKNYAHFTSPIRRYPDLMLHREIKYFLELDRKGETSDANTTSNGGYHYPLPLLVPAGEHCSETERKADEVTFAVDNWLKCEFMKDKINQSFDGIVTNVASFGIFVRLDEWAIDGLVYVANLGEDYFEVAPNGNAIIGVNSGISYRLGDKVKVTVTSVDENESRINFILAPESRNQTYKKKKKQQQQDRNS